MDARLTDITSQNAVFSLMGPHARDVLAPLTRDDISNAAFPFGQARRLSVAGAPVLALRVTYVGELGWELHVPVEFALTLYENIMASGAKFGIANAGYRAIETLRLEKFYRAWGADIGPDHTPLEAGLGWAVKLKKPIPFLGREALEAQKRDGVKKQLACFTIDDPEVILLGRETIYRDGARVGWLSSGGFGHTLQKPIGIGYVRNEAGVERISCNPAPTSWKWRASAWRPSCISPRFMMRRWSGSRRNPRRYQGEILREEIVLRIHRCGIRGRGGWEMRQNRQGLRGCLGKVGAGQCRQGRFLVACIQGVGRGHELVDHRLRRRGLWYAKDAAYLGARVQHLVRRDRSHDGPAPAGRKLPRHGVKRGDGQRHFPWPAVHSRRVSEGNPGLLDGCQVWVLPLGNRAERIRRHIAGRGRRHPLKTAAQGEAS